MLSFSLPRPSFATLVCSGLLLPVGGLATVSEARPREFGLPVGASSAAPDDAIKYWSKSELRQSMPAVSQSRADDLYKATTAVLNRMAGTFTDPLRRQRLDSLQSARYDASAYTTALVVGKTLPSGPDKDSQVQGMRSFLGLEAQRAIRTEVKSTWRGYDRLINMARVNLNLSATGDDRDHAVAAPPVRYGLIVKDIIPDQHSPRLAALSDSYDELNYAGHATVKWTIGPVTDSARRPISSPPTEPAAEKEDPDLRQWLPSPKFHTNVTTDETVDDPTRLMDKNATLPSLRWEVVQDDGLYKAVYRSTGQGQRLGLEHQVSLPVSGTLRLTQRVDDKGNAIESSASGLLVDSKLPAIGVRQHHLEKRYGADFGYSFPGQHGLTISGRGRSQIPTARPEDAPERYDLIYSHQF